MATHHVYKLVRETKTKVLNISASLVLVAMSLGGALPALVSSTANALPLNTVTVNGDTSSAENSPGWMFNRDQTTETPYVFVKGNADTGTGSLYVQPISSTHASDKFIAEDFLLTPVSNLNSFSVDYKLGPSTPASQVYFNVYANYNGTSVTNFYQCRYDVVATTGSTSTYSTLSFNPNNSYPVTTRSGSPACPSSPAAMGSGSTIRVIAVNLGDTSLSDAGDSAYFDNAVVDTTAGTTTYDFEPQAVVNDRTGYSYNQIQAAVNDAVSGDTLEVGQNIAEGIVDINKSLTIEGTSISAPVISANTDTGWAGSWFTIDGGSIVNISNLAFDGSGHQIFAGLLSHGTTTVNNTSFKNIRYDTYYGFAVVGTGGHVGGGFGGDFTPSALTVSNSTFSNIGRVGVEVKGSSSTAAISDITYTGKGNVDGLDYGVEFGSGSTGSVTGSTITNNTGVASDGSTSAAIMATTYYGSGTSFTATDNHLSGNYSGLDVGYDSNDTTAAIAHGNDLSGNTNGVATTHTTSQIDATNNWWGNATGPTDANGSDGSTPATNPGGTGSAAVGAVKYDTWCTVADCSANTATIPNAPTNPVWKNHAGTVLGAYTNVNQVTPSWTAATGSNVDHYEYSYTRPSNSTWSAPSNIGNVTSIPDQAFGAGGAGNGEQGPWQFRIRSVSAFGIDSAWATSPVIIYDYTAPTGDITFPADGQLVGLANENGKLVVRGTVQDNLSMNRVGVQLVKPGVSGQIQYLYDHMVNQNPGTWEVTFDTKALNLTDGAYGINVYFVDMAGNVTTKHITFQLDNTYPSFAINTPANNATVAGTITINAEVTDANDITKLLMNIGGHAYSWANGSSATITRNGDIFSVTIDTTTLPDGPVYVVLRATDGAGNVRYWNNNANNRQHVFYVDNSAPVVTDTFTVNLLTNENKTLQPTVTDANSPLTYLWSVSDQKLLQGNPSQPLNGTNLEIGSAPKGNYTVMLTVTDPAGNATTKTYNVTISTPASFNSLTQNIVGGRGGGNGGNTGNNAVTPQVLGAETTTPSDTTSTDTGTDGTDGQVKGDSTVKTENTASTSTKSSNFLGLGWWWLLIVAAFLGFIWFLAARRSDNDQA